MQQIIFIADFIACSTCFGHHYAHHQELESIIQMVAACGVWCFGFQVVGMVWSWGLCVRFAGSNHLYNTLELLMMGIKVPETFWESNKICNKYHLLRLVGILFYTYWFMKYFKCLIMSGGDGVVSLAESLLQGPSRNCQKYLTLCTLTVMCVPFWVFCFVLSFFVLFACKCVLYYCHWVSTQSQLTKYISYINYHTSYVKSHWSRHITNGYPKWVPRSRLWLCH